MDTKDKFIIILSIYFTYLAVFKERQSLGCKGDGIIAFLTSNPPCDNADNEYSRIIREEKPQNPFDIINRRIVAWRKSFLLSITIIFMYHLITRVNFDGINFMSGVIIGTFFIYFSHNFYIYHLEEHIYKEIMKNYTITPK